MTTCQRGRLDKYEGNSSVIKVSMVAIIHQAIFHKRYNLKFKTVITTEKKTTSPVMYKDKFGFSGERILFITEMGYSISL